MPATTQPATTTPATTIPATTEPATTEPGCSRLATQDRYRTRSNETLLIPAPGVLGNDDACGGFAHLRSYTSHGELALFGDGSFSYTPTPGFSGVDSFTYSLEDVPPTCLTDGCGETDAELVTDDRAESNVAEVVITVERAHPSCLPAPQDDRYRVLNSSILQVRAAHSGVASNDALCGGTVRLVSAPTYGSLNLQPDGTFVYEPDHGFTGRDTFEYAVGPSVDGGQVGFAPAVASDGDVVGRVVIDVMPATLPQTR
jgi:hypothetical protein